MGPRDQYDFSTAEIPAEWYEAAADAPEPVPGRLTRSKLPGGLPLGQQYNAFSAVMITIVLSGVSTYAWYVAEAGSDASYPWIPVVIGVVIALSLRFAGGEAEHRLRAAMAFGFYLVTVTVSLLLIGRADYLSLYGSTPSPADIEQQLRFGRLADPLMVGGLVMGAVATARLSYLLRHR